MVSKASLETLARTLSATALAAVGIFSTSSAVHNTPTTYTSDAATLIAVSDAATPVARATKRASRSAALRYTSAMSAPKTVVLRGQWLKAVLQEAGFEGKALKEAWAIAMRESTGRPTAHNGNRATGDNSYGLFQINMIGSLGPERRAKFGLESNDELFDPLVNAKAAYYMSAKGTNWSAWEPYNGGSKEEGFREWLSKYPA